MNKNEYYEKCNEQLKFDPTNKFKKEFISNLKELKNRKVIDHASLMKFYSVDHPPRLDLKYIKPICP